ncbi:hypothetical protein EDD85DRAFT_962902 [Armillaria nabsnona]|nr:hypothetical protein EDD85DRAFT_962902 [Armillaria nabsnona]
MATKAAATHFLQFRIQYSSIALLYHDYALTFAMEVKYVWGSKFKLSTVLYICCRYALIANVLYLLAIAKKLGARIYFGRGNNNLLIRKDTVATHGTKSLGRLASLGELPLLFAAVTFTGHTYAIFARSKIIIIYLVAIGLACIILDIMHVPGLKCVGSSNNPLYVLYPHLLNFRSLTAVLVFSADLLLSILMVVFEYSSAILRTIRIIQALRVNGPWKAQRRGFIYLIFEQGIFYFSDKPSVVSLFTTAAVILNSVAPVGFFQRLLNAFTLPLSSLLTARYLLRLRAWEDQHSIVVSGNRGIASQQMHTMKFRALSVIDEFGEDPVSMAGCQNGYALEEMPRKMDQENMPST